MKQFLPIVTASFLLISCGNSKSSSTIAVKDTTTQKEASGEKEESHETTNETHSEIKLTMTGGDMAGNHEAVCRESCCSYGIAGEKVFGYQYSENGKGPKDISSVQLLVDDVTGNKTTDQFTVTVTFGDLFGKNSKNYTINTSKGNKKGSGTLELEYSNEKAKIHIKGTSQEGPGLDLNMECEKVFDMKNIQGQ